MNRRSNKILKDLILGIYLNMAFQKRIVEEYRRRFGCYPERILADKIYRSKKNRDYCKEKAIHLSGPKLGRPGKNYAEDIRIERKEAGERNAVEGIFGNGKRKLGLSLIMEKL